MSKKCGRCEKTVYPTEELKCLDKVGRVFCFDFFLCTCIKMSTTQLAKSIQFPVKYNSFDSLKRYYKLAYAVKAVTIRINESWKLNHFP